MPRFTFADVRKAFLFLGAFFYVAFLINAERAGENASLLTTMLYGGLWFTLIFLVPMSGLFFVLNAGKVLRRLYYAGSTAVALAAIAALTVGVTIQAGDALLDNLIGAGVIGVLLLAGMAPFVGMGLIANPDA